MASKTATQPQNLLFRANLSEMVAPFSLSYDPATDVSCNIDNNGKALYALDVSWLLVGKYYSDEEKRERARTNPWVYVSDECTENAMARAMFAETIYQKVTLQDQASNATILATYGLKAAQNIGYTVGTSASVLVSGFSPTSGRNESRTETFSAIVDPKTKEVVFIDHTMTDMAGNYLGGECKRAPEGQSPEVAVRKMAEKALEKSLQLDASNQPVFDSASGKLIQTNVAPSANFGGVPSVVRRPDYVDPALQMVRKPNQPSANDWRLALEA